MTPPRRVALVVAGIGGVAFVALAAWLVPWNPVPGGVPPPADPASVFRFDEHEVVLPLVVIAELESKRDHPELGWAARRSLRLLEDLRAQFGSLVRPMPITPLGGTLRVEINHMDATGLPVIPWGDSSKLKVAEWVMAVGNPFSLNQTVTLGVVSALGRAGVGISTYEDFIQTDAAINPGNSGGALVDAGGNLVGINTAIFSRSGGSMGIGFAIPVSTAKMVLEQIVRNGSVTRGWIGVEVQEITPPVAETARTTPSLVPWSWVSSRALVIRKIV